MALTAFLEIIKKGAARPEIVSQDPFPFYELPRYMQVDARRLLGIPLEQLDREEGNTVQDEFVANGFLTLLLLTLLCP